MAVGDQVMTPAELQTVCFEATNLVNERPIERHPQSPEEGTYLCPNDLLLGRATARAPRGPFLKTTNPNHRHEFVQKSVDSFWKKWTRDYFPSLIVRQKWHTERRNLKEGDIVLFQDSNLVRGNWKLGRVSQVFPSQDGKVTYSYWQIPLNEQSSYLTTFNTPFGCYHFSQSFRLESCLLMCFT